MHEAFVESISTDGEGRARRSGELAALAEPPYLGNLQKLNVPWGPGERISEMGKQAVRARFGDRVGVDLP
jgi:hypothetical protein